MESLSIADLIQIANEAQVLKRMSLDRTTRVVVDHIPARSSMSIAREPGEEDELEAYAPEVITITYTLADAMFGGSIYVALTCGNRVIVHPFLWSGYEHLGTVSIAFSQH